MYSVDVMLSIKEQGVYAAGGIVQSNPGTFDPIKGQLADAGQIRHADHTSVYCQIPEHGNGRKIMFMHGYGGSKAVWQTTPYCKGFADIFLEKGYGVYLTDRPRSGEAGAASTPLQLAARPDELTWFTQFRLGMWPDFHDGSQFPISDNNIDQFFRMMTPDTGVYDNQVVTDATVTALKKSGSAAIITHSQGGIPGWFVAMASDNVASIIAIEPGTFVMPEAEMPAPVGSTSAFATNGKMGVIPVPMDDFLKLTKVPIAIYFGDYIPDQPSEVPAYDHWRVVREFAHKFADCTNKYGGNAKVVYLPDEGVHGNSHFMFQEKNNQQIADHMMAWLDEVL